MVAGMDTTAPPQHLTVSDAARVLGISPQTVRQLAHAGELPGAYRIGTAIRIPPEAIAAYAAAHPVTGPDPRRDSRRHGHQPAGRAPKRKARR
jgi:excisionase family DNA binding protein